MILRTRSRHRQLPAVEAVQAPAPPWLQHHLTPCRTRLRCHVGEAWVRLQAPLLLLQLLLLLLSRPPLLSWTNRRSCSI
jgi:hypothetical protein